MKNDNFKKKIEIFNTSETIEQTFLSWIQTGLTLVGVGFGISGIIVALRAHHYEDLIIKVIRIIGQLLIFVGFVTTVLAIIQHKHKIQSLKNENDNHIYQSHLPLYIGITIACLGVIAFLAILLHMAL